MKVDPFTLGVYVAFVFISFVVYLPASCSSTLEEDASTVVTDSVTTSDSVICNQEKMFDSRD